MRAIVLGDGPMGRAVAAGLAEGGHEVPAVLGRPESRHPPARFAGADVAFDFSRGDAVLANLAAGVAGGCRRFVVGTTAWTTPPAEIVPVLVAHDAAAVASPSFSPGVAVLGRLVDEALRLVGGLDAYDPFVLEWHRRAKADRPSGTALALAGRILAAHPTKARIADRGAAGRLAENELEVSSVRAGASPGMHVVGFDAPGETIELRVTARDRSAYVLGAIASAAWLLAEPRTPGLHAFDEVLDEGVAGRAHAMA